MSMDPVEKLREGWSKYREILRKGIILYRNFEYSFIVKSMVVIIFFFNIWK